MKRFEPYRASMDESDTGDYVRHADAAACIAEQEAELAAFARQMILNGRRLNEQEAELATLRAENAHLKRALALTDALRDKERNLPL